MTEAKLMAEFEQHDKVEACSLAAVGLFALGLSFAVRELTDGFIPIAWAESKTREPAGGSAAQQLVDEGLWEPVEDGYRVHDFAVYNPTKAVLDRRRREREKKRAQRLSRRAGTSPGDVPGEGRGRPRPGADDRLADAVSLAYPVAAGLQDASRARFSSSLITTSLTTPVETQTHSSEASTHGSKSRSNGAREAKKRAARDREWEEWLEHCRATTGRGGLKGSKADRQRFNARLDEGFTLEELKLATVGVQSRAWHVRQGYNVPKTILNGNARTYVEWGRDHERGIVASEEPEHPASRRIRQALQRAEAMQ